MTSKKTTKKVAAVSSASEQSESDAEDEQLIFGGENAIDGYNQPTGEQTQQSSQAQGHNFVHLHFQKRNARQCLTAVRGLPDDLDMRKLTRHFKKAWCCNGTTSKHSEWGDIIQLQGDHRRDIFKFLIDEGISTKEEIKIHGY